MQVFFRTDASLRIGTGHVMRCLTLARALLGRGARVGFICGDLEGNLMGHIRDQGIPVHALPRERGGESGNAGAPGSGALPAHHAWLGTGWETDARQSAEALGDPQGAVVDWLVVDHYALDSRWEQEMSGLARRILVIDDIADRPHAGHAILDQNFYDDPAARYAGWVPAGTALLLGPEYALLRPEFAHAKRPSDVKAGSLKRVLVFFGGADAINATAKAMEAITLPEFSDLEADVVVGATNPHRRMIEEACRARPGTVFHCQAGNMAGLMAAADLALGAGGTTTWERCCLGLPALVASVADNQRELTRTSARHGLIRDLGWGGDLTADGIADALRWCRQNPERLAAMSRLGSAIVDGLGAERVADRMLGMSGEAGPAQSDGMARPPRLKLRAASPSDILTYFRWTNDPETRTQSFRSEPVALDGHERWFTARLADPGTRLYLLESDGEPAGQIRYQLRDGFAWIGFSVDARYRGKGLGAYLLRTGAERLREERPDWIIRGAVKKSNPASRKVFERSGFRRLDDILVDGEPSFLFQYSESRT